MILKKNGIMIFIVSAFAVFLATFNETFMNVALNEISISLNVEFSIVQWLVTAYMLGAGIMVAISSFLYRKIPTKILFSITIGLFIIGSIVGGLSGNSFILVLLGRIIQAIGSGMLIPISMNIVLEVAPKQKLGSYMGIMGAMTTLGPSLSVILSGAILSFGNFHTLFWVFGALCLICFILGLIFVDNVSKLTKPKLDILSVILISLSLIGILYAISAVFSNTIIAIICFTIGALSLILFIIRQKNIKEPLINFEPLKNKVFRISVILNMIALIIVFAFNVLLPQYLQSVTGTSALHASLTLFPAIFLCCIIAPIAGRFYDNHGIKGLLYIGFILMICFAIILGLFISSPSLILIGALYLPISIGSAFIIGPVQSYGLSSLKPEQNPHGVTIFSTGFQIAGCIGASLFTSIYSSLLRGSSNFVSSANNSFLICVIILAFIAFLAFVLSIIVTNIRKNKPSNKVLPNYDVTSIMKKDIYTINANTSILDVMKLFIDKKISGCPIVNDENKFVGFISDGDIVRFLSKNSTSIKFAYAFNVTNGENASFDNKLHVLLKLNVTDIASKDLFWIETNQDLGEVCKLLADLHKKKVPVMENGKMVGIITRSDITKYIMAKNLEFSNQIDNINLH